jgi:hypothetical protein
MTTLFNLPLITIKNYLGFILSSIILFAFCLFFYFNIISFNSGVFAYTLDDPYIHLALGKNIFLGTYGVNINEFSSPSSSILWPFILSIFSKTDSYIFIPLFLNIFFTFFTILFITQTVKKLCPITSYKECFLLQIFCASLIILSSNTFNLIFNGMEHSLQVLFVAATFYFFILFFETGKLSKPLVACIIFAPLIRYENLALSFCTITYIATQKRILTAITISAATALPIFLFSLFLNHLQLPILPSSVLAKSSIQNLDASQWLLLHIVKSYLTPSGHFFFISIIAFGFIGLFLPKKERLLLFAFSLPSLLHILFGKYDWFLRYEMYAITWNLLSLFYVIHLIIQEKILTKKIAKYGIAIILFLLFCTLYLVCLKNYNATKDLAIQSNYTFSQPYQMSRIALEHNEAVGVNDLGYVALNHNKYVLDFWGLASTQALSYRLQSEDSQWMDALAKKHRVNLVMLTESWFPTLPSEWTTIAYLCLRNPSTKTANGCISIIATNESSINPIYQTLKKIEAELPYSSNLVWNKN